MITRDDIIKMAREAGITAGAAPHPCCIGAYCSEYNLERFAALVAAAERERIEADRQPPIYSQPPYTSGCPVCRMGANGTATAYVCNRGDCPTRVTCAGAV